MRGQNRPLLSHGPIIRTLEALTAFSAVASIAALAFAISAQNSRIDVTEQRLNFVQTARARAAEDTCFLLRGLVISATPRGELKRAYAYIDSTQLRDCQLYGNKIAGQP